MPGAQAEGPPVSCSWPHRTTAAATRFRRRQRIPFRWRAVACRGWQFNPSICTHLNPKGGFSEPGVAPHMWRGRQSWLQIVGSRPVSDWLARVAVLALAPNSWLATCLQIVGAGGGVGSKELAPRKHPQIRGAKTRKYEQSACGLR